MEKPRHGSPSRCRRRRPASRRRRPMSQPTTHSDDPFRAGRALGLDHLKVGMWLFLGSEVMFFGGLISAFLHYKVNNPTPESGFLDVGLVGINTFLLLASSFTVVSALA